VYVMADHEVLRARGRTLNAVVEIVFGTLNQVWGVKVVIVCVYIEIGLS